MSSFNCKTCGAPLEVSAFANTSVCEYCGTANDLKRDNIQRLDSDTLEISPEEYKKQLDRAAAAYEKGFYDKALQTADDLKRFTRRDIQFSTLYAEYFLAAKVNELIGKRGIIERSWEDSCDNSGACHYGNYSCPDFESIFDDFENLMEDAEELIGSGDTATSESYAIQIIKSIQKVADLGRITVSNFIDTYGFTAEEKTKNIEIGDKWTTIEYTDHDRNDQAESVAIEIAKDLSQFYAKTFMRLLANSLISPSKVDFKPCYEFLSSFIEDKSIPHCTFKKVRFKENIASQITELIEDIYDYNLIKDHTAQHPLGSSVDFEKLCDYSSKIRKFGKKYIDQGLIATSLVESFIQKTDDIRDDALAIRKVYRVGFWSSWVVGGIMAVSAPIWGTPAAGGLILGAVCATIYGRKLTGDTHKALTELAIISERSIRAEATRKRFSQSMA